MNKREKGKEFYQLGLEENLKRGFKAGILKAYIGLDRYDLPGTDRNKFDNKLNHCLG